MCVCVYQAFYGNKLLFIISRNMLTFTFWHLKFKLDSSTGVRNPEACLDPEDKGDCFNYFPWMADLALVSAWGKALGAWCTQPCNYAFKSIFLINLNMLEKLTWLESENPRGPGTGSNQGSLMCKRWSHLSWAFERCLLEEENECSNFQNLEEILLFISFDSFLNSENEMGKATVSNW